MKFNINKLLAVLAVASLGVACNKEQLQDEIPSSGNGTVQVVVSIDNGTRSFSDAEGVKWEVGDQIKYAGGVELTSEPLTDKQITENGYKASFTFDKSLIEADRTGWFCSTKCHPTNYTEVEFTLGTDNGNLFTQAEAGQMNSRYLFLHSGTGKVNITQGVLPEVKMEIAGTIFRVIPYTTTYNDEQILSVKLSSNTNLVGTVSYNRGNQTYTGVTELLGGAGYKSYNFVKANLGTPFSLEGITSAETSKGIYFAVAATPANKPLVGYKYEVETDKANYVFDAMTDTLAVRNNFVKNVYLNLDNAARVTESGLLKYSGALNDLITIPSDGCSDFDAGYWQASTSTDGGAPWTVRNNAENAAFYSSVQFSYADATTGKPADWISVVYGGSDLCHWRVTAQENTGEERSVKVTATYSDVKGYKIIEESKTKELTITQAAAGSKKVVEYASVSLPDSTEFEAAAQVKINVGYCLLKIDGDEKRDWADKNSIYARSHFAYVSEENYAAKNYTTDVDWLSCHYANNGTAITDCIWFVSATENTTGAPRTAYVVCVFPEDDGYQFPEPRALKITQKANTTVVAEFSEFPTGAVVAAGGTVTGKLSLTINGDNQTDVTTAISTYGLSLSVNKGATATVDASGNVEVVIPENKYKNGGVEYTLSLKKNDGTVAASFVITQEEGTEEVTTVKYTYTLTKNNGNASGAIWGMNVNAKNGDDFTITDVKLNDQPVTLDEVSAAAVLAQAIKCLPEKPAADYDGYTVIDNGQIYINVVNFSGSTLKAGVATTDSSQRYITKLVWYDSDGTEAGNWFIFVP
ncbi:MAG: hypothetical protein SPD85_01310 [Candidatus Cryptobacteroides sp.]|nr:hypothetical protein [Candidatus Cryptobacteroides sp.]